MGWMKALAELMHCSVPSLVFKLWSPMRMGMGLENEVEKGPR